MTINILSFGIFLHICTFPSHLAPVPFGTTIVRLIEGMYHSYEMSCLLIILSYILFAFLMHFCTFPPHLAPVPFGTTIIRLIKGMYHPYEIVSLTSDHTFPHIFRIFDAFLYLFTTFDPSPLDDYYQTH